MGSYATCWLGRFDLGDTKSEVDPNLMTLFRDTDKVAIHDSTGEEVSVERFTEYLNELYNEDEHDEDSTFSIMYVAPVNIVRDRLQVMGYSLQTCKEFFELAIRRECESLVTHMDSESVKKSDLLTEHYQSQHKALSELDADRWIEKMKLIESQGLEKVHFHSPDRKPNEDAIIEYMLTTDWYGYPGYDFNIAVRLALEACSDAELLRYDFTDLVAGEYYSPNDNLVEMSVGRFEDDHRTASKIIILTEGKSDAHILSEAIKLLYPHVADYYSFMEFEAMRYGGGAGNLVNLLKAFAGAGVANRTIGLFDNDTAGTSAILGLDGVGIPSYIQIRKLPNIDALKEYPTLGPTGPLNMDVNGVAASIELYLGNDVLTESGSLIPIQWTGYDWKVKSYQGEIMKKDIIHRRFLAKINRAKAGAIRTDDPVWEPLKAVFEMIFGAFEAFDRDRMMSVFEDYSGS